MNIASGGGRNTGELALRCRCGAVHARAVEVAPRTVNAVVCYCHDCRAFVRWLDRLDVVDAAGGTEIIQMARGRVLFEQGIDELQCLRLSEKGLFRWYAGCCKTPVGNTVPWLPFIGVIGAFIASPEPHTPLTGTPLAIMVGSATQPVAPSVGKQLRMGLHVARLFGEWVLRGLKGDVLFDRRTNAPRVTPQVLSAAERAALQD